MTCNLWFNHLMNILYQDECLLVVNKPAGLSVLPEGWEPNAPYLVKMLEQEYSKIWVIHRVDKITSGIVVFALTADAHRSLNIQFEKHQVDKKYHAIVNGLPGWDEKITKFPLRVNVGHKHRTMVDNKSGVKVRDTFQSLATRKKFIPARSHPDDGSHAPNSSPRLRFGIPAPRRHALQRPRNRPHRNVPLCMPILWLSTIQFQTKEFHFTAPYPPDFEAFETFKVKC